MSPVKHRSGGRRFKGGRDTQREERFAPGVRGAEFPPPVWTEGINFALSAHAQAANIVATKHSQGNNWSLEPGA